MAFPRYYRQLYREERDEIGGQSGLCAITVRLFADPGIVPVGELRRLYRLDGLQASDAGAAM